MNPDEAVADELALAALGVVGTSIFLGPVRAPQPPAIPHAAIFVLQTGGPPPTPYFRFGGVSDSFYRVNVQVRVRGAVQAFAAGQLTARAVRTALHLADLPGAVACRAQNAEPLYLGLDDTEHPEWAVNVSVEFKS